MRFHQIRPGELFKEVGGDRAYRKHGHSHSIAFPSMKDAIFLPHDKVVILSRADVSKMHRIDICYL